MQLHLSSLKIECNNGNVKIPFADGISFFYGNSGVGKTTLLNLVNYTLGQEVVRTKTISNEIKSVQLEAFISGKRVLLTRKIGSGMIIVKDGDGENRLYAKGGSGTDSKNEKMLLSEYFYKASGAEPLLMTRGRSSGTTRVTISNFMWYSYLRQDELDNNFFYLGERNLNFKSYASEYVLKSLLWDCPQDEFESKIRLNHIREQEAGLKENLSLIRKMMGISRLSQIDINNEITKKQRMVAELKDNADVIQNGFDFNTDDLEKLVNCYYDLGRFEAEIVYLKEFNKFNKLASEYENDIKRLKDESVRIDVNDKHREEVFDKHLAVLEKIFEECLRGVSFPDFEESDRIHMDRKTLIPSVVMNSGKIKYDFTTISSGGIRTIFKICFAIAVHIYVHENNILTMLPDMLIIDTPMKNISERTDSLIYDRLYSYIYDVFGGQGRLNKTQLIIVDKEFPAAFDGKEIPERLIGG